MRPDGRLRPRGKPEIAPGTPISVVSHSLTSTSLQVRDCVVSLCRALEDAGFTSDERWTVELVLAEVLNNVVEHAYADRDDGIITVRMERHVDGLRFFVEDRGVPMPHGQIVIGRPPRSDVAFDDLPEGGFGWLMIQHLARDVQYRREADRNALIFRIAVGIRKSKRASAGV